MDKKTKGSWLIYQTGKLQKVTDQSNFESSYLAGKAGILLSAISKDSQGVLDNQKIATLAKASGINTLTEMPILLDKLSEQSLIDSTKNGVEVLGITTMSCLQHTADIFDGLNPTNIENASIELCEKSSNQPLLYNEIQEDLSDNFRLSTADSNLVLDQSCAIGFVDSEEIDSTSKFLFNGNLFRRDDVIKVQKVLNSLSAEEAFKVEEFSERLTKEACIPIEKAKRHFGGKLFKKLASVGIYDISVVSNNTEEVPYVTRPSAFSKFSNSMVEDVFDLAKMFVSSLTYGMTRSPYARGQIQMIEALMNTLIAGQPVGPVYAIGQDYNVLEMKHVVEVFQGSKKGRIGYMMRLLKRDVGQLALEVIKHADASAHSLAELPSAAVNSFQGPERNRTEIRRREVKRHPKSTNDILLSLRTGGRI
ncbi:MAG: hypothetical protein IME95_08920 [Proteobacteria bacterium]|nr:hypothetical protein [Pseudomonadota bacterium]